MENLTVRQYIEIAKILAYEFRDYWWVALALGIDYVCLLVNLIRYFKERAGIKRIKKARQLTIEPKLEQILRSCAAQGGSVPYVIIQGTVTALNQPIQSAKNVQLTGVIQSLILRECRSLRSIAGNWKQSEHVIQQLYNAVPFALSNNNFNVTINDALSADMLFMQMTCNVCNQPMPNMADRFMNILSGIHPGDIEITEQMLTEGTFMTAIGELTVCPDDGCIMLTRPSNGYAYYLTPLDIPSLIRKLEYSKSRFGWRCFAFFILSFVIVGLGVRKYLKNANREEEPPPPVDDE